GVNAVDGTDANWFTVDEEMGVTTANFMPNPTSYAFINKMGDPRWNWDYTFDLSAVIEANGLPQQKVENQKVAAKLNSTETVVTVYLPANELKNWKMASAILNIPCTFEGGVITMSDAVPAESVVFVNPASENVTATDVKVNGSIDTNGENATVEVKVNVPGIGAVTVTYNGVNTTDIKNVESAAAVKSVNAKFIENGRVVIVKNGAKFNVAGQVIK
ncbi:MAG: hypothetical protein KBT39_11460, partial [Bacteroidales bacterium]|nr:hypothetical protein [Bacteroidales bacterium]